MGVLKLSLDEFDEVDYQLIAIHTSLEDFRLAFFINRQLPIILKKCNHEISVKTKDVEAAFSRFIFEDETKDMFWTLVENAKQVSVMNPNQDTLFGDNNPNGSVAVYLLPELKKVDFLLKIENAASNFSANEVVKKLNQIDWISTVYEVDAQKIKSKNNLIF